MQSILVIATLCYIALAYHFYRSRWLGARASLTPTSENLLIVSVIFLHTAGIYTSLKLTHGLNFGLGTTASILGLLTVSFFWLGNQGQRLSAIYAALLPLAALSIGMQLFFTERHLVTLDGNIFLICHLLFALAAYSIMSIAMLLAGAMLLTEFRLTHIRNSNTSDQLPPLLALEKLLFITVAVGFTLLSLTLISGSANTYHTIHQWLTLTHKSLFTFAAWLVFGILLVGRKVLGWRGRLAAKMTITGASFLLLGYLGSKFVLEIILHRPG